MNRPRSPHWRRGALAVAIFVVAGCATTLATTQRLAADQANRNALVGDQSTFGSSTGGWVGNTVNVRQVSSPSYQEPGSLQLTPSGSTAIPSAWSGAPGPTASPYLTHAIPGLVYTGTADVLSGSGSSLAVNAALEFWDASGSLLKYLPSQSTTATGSWSLTAPVVAIAPPASAYVALGVEVRNSSGNWSLNIDDASLQPLHDLVQPVVGPLRTSGTQILDGNGQPVVLRGIDYYGLAARSESATVNSDTFQKLHAWGTNLVRISLNEDYWMSQSCAYDANYEHEVVQVVQDVTQLGMVALLDDHLTNPSDIGSAVCPKQVAEDAPSNPATDWFWTSVAATFKNNPLVAFDLFNEPHNISFDVWRSGGSANGIQAEGMQQLYQDVRSEGAGNLVFVEGNNWAFSPPPSGYLLNGYNIVYDVHWYTCPDNPPPTCTYQGGDPYTDTSPLQAWVSFQNQQQEPVFVGEFGWPDQTNGTFISSVITFAENHGWGWDVFAYDGTTNSPYSMVSSIPPSSPPEPSGAGMPVLNDLASHTPQPPAVPPSGSGYWMAASDGGIFAFGVPYFGSMGGTQLAAPIVSMASPPDDWGYWEVASDGGVFAFGGATYAGSMGGSPLNAPIVAMAADPVTGGYWLVASDGGIFAFDAPFYGSTGNLRLNKPIVTMVPTPDGLGYWLVASDGGVFSFGDARYLGSMGSTVLNKPIVSAQATPDGLGYWLAAADGGIFSFGDARFLGSTGALHLARPITAMEATPDAGGYWLVAADGGVFAFGDAPFAGSLGGNSLATPVIAGSTPP
ncbi:MAG: glycoside hydrolase family 5 protein [Acidimicrobiales bacterium]